MLLPHALSTSQPTTPRKYSFTSRCSVFLIKCSKIKVVFLSYHPKFQPILSEFFEQMFIIIPDPNLWVFCHTLDFYHLVHQIPCFSFNQYLFKKYLSLLFGKRIKNPHVESACRNATLKNAPGIMHSFIHSLIL